MDNRALFFIVQSFIAFAALAGLQFPDAYALCAFGETRTCGSNIGICSFGLESCMESGEWGNCTGSAGPGNETCNGLDDNCNGKVDEGNVCLSTLAPACKENWVCSEWLPCFNASKTIRVCDEINRCNTSFSKPVTEKPCFEESFFGRVQNLTSQAAKNIGIPVSEQNVLSYSVVIFVLIFMFLAWLLSVDRNRKTAVVSDGEKKT